MRKPKSNLQHIAILCCLLAAGPMVLAGNPILVDGKPGLADTGIGTLGDAQPVVLDIVLHSRKDILKMLSRVEKLAMTPNPSERPENISLVLHGPEIRHFQISRYDNNRNIVDLAAKLDAFNVIDIKMCNTQMTTMGIDKKDIPAFIEIVPYGPAEVERLQSKGFLKL